MYVNRVVNLEESARINDIRAAIRPYRIFIESSGALPYIYRNLESGEKRSGNLKRTYYLSICSPTLILPPPLKRSLSLSRRLLLLSIVLEWGNKKRG